ncbi:hypothetical protein INR49_018331 [Caranx melampygus]|nr:hypothetical protein INR49_018331 [Caranx melampygus]
MAGLCWTAVVLVLLLSTENNVSADDGIDIKDIKTVVDFVVKRYKIDRQVSVAANIPENQDLNKLNNLLPKNDDVQNEFNKKKVL